MMGAYPEWGTNEKFISRLCLLSFVSAKVNFY